MESVKDYYVEYIRVKQSFTRATKLQVEEVSKLKAQLAYHKRENYALRTKLRQVNEINQAQNYKEVLDNVCNVFEITMDELKGSCRLRKLVLARHIAMYIMRNDFNFSLKKIGSIFAKDHATVIHGCKQIQNVVDLPQFHKDEHHYYLKCKGI